MPVGKGRSCRGDQRPTHEIVLFDPLQHEGVIENAVVRHRLHFVPAAVPADSAACHHTGFVQVAESWNSRFLFSPVSTRSVAFDRGSKTAAD